MRLIDADALLEELPVHPDGGLRTVKEECLMIRVRETVKAAPTIGGWISVKDRLPEETESMFERFHATEKWDRAMWRRESDSVLVYVSFPDGGRRVTVGRTHDGKWNTSVSKMLPHKVTHWQYLPEPPEVKADE